MRATSLYSAAEHRPLLMLEAYSDLGPTADDTNIPESAAVSPICSRGPLGLGGCSVGDEAEGSELFLPRHYGPYGTNFRHRPAATGPATLATARAVGSLAYASTLWRRFDAGFADRALQAARRGVQYLDLHPEFSDGPTCPAYRAEGDVQVGHQTRMFAAAGMLLATGESRYREEFERNFEVPDSDPSYLKMGGFAAQLYLRSPAGDPARKASLTRWLR
jgi:hypothetical protein